MDSTSPLRIGTRRSRLALVQTEWVQARIEALGIPTTLIEIVAEGDKKLGQPLYKIETPQPGLFTKELERALLAGQIDVAVHSLKDLPTQLADGLELLAVPQRERVEDCLLVRGDRGGIDALAKGAVVGTSSLRREAALIEQRPDLQLRSIRGNVQTRIEALRRGDYQGIVLARAGLNRLGIDALEDIAFTSLDPEHFVPAPGQGALAVEIAASLPSRWREPIAKALDHATTRFCTRIERRILRELEGGCTLPLGVWCRSVSSGTWKVSTFLGLDSVDPSGKRQWKGFQRFDISGQDEQILVAQTVQHFRPQISR